ncbi:MAG TPA: PilZ domain-containing protein [Polyangiaceae bacterium]
MKHIAMRMKDLIAASRVRPLADEELHECEKLRRALADGYVLAQKLTLRPGQFQRRSRRVAYLLKVTVTSPGFSHKTATMNLSNGGFAALLPDQPAAQTHADFVLHTRFGPLHGKARIVSTLHRDRSWLTSFAIEEMNEGARRALEDIVFDQVLATLTN